MLAQALRSSVSQSALNYNAPDPSSSCSGDLAVSLLESSESTPSITAPDHDFESLDTPKCTVGLDGELALEPWADLEMLAPADSGVAGSQAPSIDDLCRSMVSSLRTTNSSTPNLECGNSSSSGMSIARSMSAGALPVIARSCPKPIARRGRQLGSSSGLVGHREELSVFVPPHELAASSLLDPTNVADSLCRKGSAAIRLRAGVLRRTGFLEGQTEVLRPAGPVTASLKQ